MLLIRHPGQAGNQDHRDALGHDLLLQFFQQRKAIHTGHHHIQQNQRELTIFGGGQALLRSLRHGDIIFVLQDRLQLCRLYQAVIHD